MSDEIKARRATAEITFDGVDVTETIKPYFISLTYTDNEEDGADDLQIELQDRGNDWLGNWLGSLTEAASTPDPEAKAKAEAEQAKEMEEQKALAKAGTYTVTAKSGLNIRSGPGTENKRLGAFEHGAAVEVKRIDNGWAQIEYSGTKAYVAANYLSKRSGSSGTNAKGGSTSSGPGQIVDAMFTAYGPFPDEGGPLGANGEELTPSDNTCAAPPSIPFGYLITVQGTGTSRDGQTYRVNDRGTAIQITKSGVYHFDILMSSKAEENEWGVRYGKATIRSGSSSSSSSKSSVHSLYSSNGDEDQSGESSNSSSAEKKDNSVGVPGVDVPGKLKIEAVIKRLNWTADGLEETLSCGTFELDDTEVQGPPMTVSIRATSLPFTSGMRQTEKTKTWEKCKLSEIAKKMASNAGLVLMFDSEKDPKYDSVEQYKMSDIEFLSSLCQRAGMALKASNKMLIIFEQAAYEKKTPILIIKPRGGLYTDFSLQRGTADTQCTACRVSYVLPSGKSIEGIAYSSDYDASQDHKQLEITAKVADSGEAKTLAEIELRRRNKYERTATFTLPGNPFIAAGEAVALTGWGQWDGKYIIKQAQHTIDNSGYITKITLRWALEIVVEVEGIKEKKKDGEYYSYKGGNYTLKVDKSAGDPDKSGTAAAFVKTAAKEVGYRESGVNNTKYGNNGKLWCAYFVSWCADQSGAPVPTTYGAVADFEKYFRAKGLYHSRSSGYIPKSGDIMIQGDKHIGIVEWANSSAVHTIEGNTSDKVKRMTRKYSEITGFCTPWE